jgi:nucleoside-diphosphate-sugar epimerase
MTKRRILVAGAGNFIGARVMEALLACGWAEPIALGRAATAPPDQTGAPQGIVNAAAGGAQEIRALARLTADTARAAGSQTRVVHLSSMTVYGAAEGLIDETAPPRADLGAYAAAHIDAERTVAGHENTVILRPGCEYGPACPQWSGRIARLLHARRLGDLGAAGDGCCNLLYVDNLVAAILASLQHPDVGGEVFNLAMRSAPTWNDYLIAYGIALRAVPIRRITARRLMVEAKLLAPPLKAMEMLGSRLFGGLDAAVPAITPSLLQLCRQRIVLDVGKAEGRLGMTWTPLRQGLANAAQAYGRPRAA